MDIGLGTNVTVTAVGRDIGAKVRLIIMELDRIFKKYKLSPALF